MASEREPQQAQCDATTTDDNYRTHRVIRCRLPAGHEGPHFATAGGSRQWRQYQWPIEGGHARSGAMNEDETVTLSGLGLDDEVADLKRQLAAEREANDDPRLKLGTAGADRLMELERLQRMPASAPPGL